MIYPWKSGFRSVGNILVGRHFHHWKFAYHFRDILWLTYFYKKFANLSITISVGSLCCPKAGGDDLGRSSLIRYSILSESTFLLMVLGMLMLYGKKFIVSDVVLANVFTCTS